MSLPPQVKRVAPLLIDVVAPIAVYYALHAAGVHDAVALGVGALIPGVSTGGKAIRSKKLDQLGLFMTLMLVVGVALVFVTGNPRLILVKPALFVGAAGIFCFISLAGKPFMMTVAKPMATEGDKRLEALWESSWRDSQPFRSAIRMSTVVFGTALLVDAIGRVIVVYTTPVGESISLANAPGLIAIALAIIFHLKTVKPVFHSIKDSELPEKTAAANN